MKKNIFLLLCCFASITYLNADNERPVFPQIDEYMIPEWVEILIKDAIDSSYSYYSLGVSDKVRLRFLEAYSSDQNNAHFVRETYQKVVMLEVADNTLSEIFNISKIYGLEGQRWFWDKVHIYLKEKFTSHNDCLMRIEYFVRLRKLNCPICSKQ